MAEPWTTRDYEHLFRNHRPTEPRGPRGEELDELTVVLGRSPGAVVAQWNDARSAVLESKTAASEQLLGYLQRRGWLRPA